ncbi:MAG: helix-turn-helix domain-containing protein [Christensenellales bacterium]|jgi:predicted DNA-binding transcriptional regulator AlpA
MTTMPKPGGMLSARDLSEQLGISKSSAYELMRRLPHYNIAPPGSKYQMLRVRKIEVERYLKQMEVRA